MEVKYIDKTPTVDDFNQLTEAVGWRRRENVIVEEALKHTLYSVCAYDEDKLIGYGRIIGDKTIFLHIHDVMVRPDYQGIGIGTGIMNKILDKVNEYRRVNLSIKVYLGASKGKEGFYEKFGFVGRPNGSLGAGMVWNSNDISIN